MCSVVSDFAMGNMQGGSEPRLTHGICPACYAAVVGMLEDPAMGESGVVTLGAIHAP